MGHPRLRRGGAVSRQTAAQKRYSFGQIAIFGLDPPAIDGSLSTPEGETLLGRHRNELVCPLAED